MLDILGSFMQYDFKIFYIIKEGYCFQSWLYLQNCECQDHEDTVDLRLHMLLWFALDSEKNVQVIL